MHGCDPWRNTRPCRQPQPMEVSMSTPDVGTESATDVAETTPLLAR
jgi:hypothetical protein